MGIAGVHRHIDAPTSYLPAVRRGFTFGPDADKDVQRWRRMGASWQTVAANLGCSVHLARQTWDPSYAPVHAAAQPIVPPSAPGAPAPGRIYRGTYQHDALAALDPGPLSRTELGAKLTIRVQDFNRMIQRMVEKRLVCEPRKALFQITAAGAAELRRLEAETPVAKAAPEAAPASTRRIGAEGRRERANKMLMALSVRARPSADLADLCGISVQLACDMLKSLKESGDIEGRPYGRGRGHLWSLTDAGQARVDELASAAHD